MDWNKLSKIWKKTIFFLKKQTNLLYNFNIYFLFSFCSQSNLTLKVYSLKSCTQIWTTIAGQIWYQLAFSSSLFLSPGFGNTNCKIFHPVSSLCFCHWVVLTVHVRSPVCMTATQRVSGNQITHGFVYLLVSFYFVFQKWLMRLGNC